MSSGVEFYFRLLVQNVVFTQFQVAGVAPSNDIFFAGACKDFSPPFLTFIRQTCVQSPSEEIEVATCPVTVLPIK